MAETLASILSPADDLAGRWAKRVRDNEPDERTGDDVFLAVSETLVRHLADGDPVHCPNIGTLSVGSLMSLRQVAHERVSSAGEASVVPSMLTRLDEAVDALLVECVEGRIRDLELDAFADPLTGAGNRRALERDLKMHLAQVERYQHTLSIVMIDLDGLKAINDVEGHDAGDRLLRELSATFTGELRASDGFYRVGGDEFVTVLPHTDRPAAEAFVERVRVHSPSFSAGIATAPLDAVAVSELIEAADQRLIRHRTKGRGRRPAPKQPAQRSPETKSEQVVIGSVSTTVDDETTTVDILLRQGALERAGRASGPAIVSAEPGIAAAATLEAFRRLGLDVGAAAVESSEVRAMAGRDVVTVVINTRAGDMEIVVTGSSVVRRGVAEASATATVQALARRLPARQVIHV
jgi:diguanylate cyclase (GGDEF)-like protein